MKRLVGKNIKIVLPFILALFMSVSFFSASVSADYFSGSRSNSGNPYAYYDSSVSKYGYVSHYDAGRNYWNKHASVNIKKTTTTSSTTDRYYIGTTSTSGLLGRISPKNSSGVEVSTSSYWSYVTVSMYDNQMRAQSNFTASYIRMNAAHEIGHSIKMAHAAKAYNSVMPQGWRAIPSSLTTYDSGEISKKWGM